MQAPFLLAVLCTAALSPEDLTLDLRVLAVRGDLVEIDRGTLAGVAVGDPVILRPLGRPEVQGTVQAVATAGATVLVVGGGAALAPGTPGVVRIPEGRLAPPEAGAPTFRNPDERWDEGLPLLAEARSPRPKERPSAWTGRAWAGAYVLQDDGALPRDDRVLRLGLAAEGQNPFGRGGRLRIAGELRAEDIDYVAPDFADDSATFLRVDSLSYEWGGTREAPTRYEVGRFLPFVFPELGLLDGVEASHRFASGARVGATLGALAGLDRDRSFGDAPQAALWSVLPFHDDRAELGLALQETWYEGEQDRDLVLTRLRWTDGAAWRADATAWFDYYRSEDVGRSSSFELTEARASVTRLFEGGAGIRVDFASFQPPIVRRERPQALALEELREAETAALALWLPQGARTTWSARLGGWRDDDLDGSWGELGFDRRLDRQVIEHLHVAALYTTGRDGDILGMRLRLGGLGLAGRWYMGADLGVFQRPDVQGGDESLDQNALRAGWSRVFGGDWQCFIDLAQRFGDEQDALSLDITLQRSF